MPVPTSVTPGVSALAFTHIGQERSVMVVVRDQVGTVMTGVKVTWVSDDPDVVTVSPTGVVTAVGDGSTTISGSVGDATTSISAVVRQVAASVTPSEPSWSFSSLGDTLRLSVAVADSGGTAVASPALAWASIDTAVASVDGGGLVSARGNGTTAVTVSVDGIVASTSITVEQLPTAMSAATDSIGFAALTDTATVSVDVTDAGGSVVPGIAVAWSSSDERVATVSAEGRVRAVGNGAALVSATAGSVRHDVIVIVQQVVAEIELLPDSVVLRDPGNSEALDAIARDALGSLITSPPIVWATRDPTVVSVDAAGLVEGVGTGSTWVTAAAGTATDSLPARVEPELTLLGLGLDDPAAEVDTEISLSARVEDILGAAYAGVAVSWSADPGSGSIVSATTSESDATGHVGAVWKLGTAAGPQRATASLETRGKTVSVAFTATAEAGAAVTASLVADSVLLSARGETAFLSPTYADVFGNPTAGSGVTWQSSDPLVATVASDGLVTGMAEGTTWIEASLGSPVDSILVTVEMRGAITITFDDGRVSVYDNAFPVLQELDLTANVGVITEAIGWPDYLSEAMLDELDAAGWAMVSHTVSHDSLTTLSPAELDYELRASQQWLVDRGYRGSNVLIAPYHDFGATEKIAAAGYYTAARGTSANAFVPDSLVSWMPDAPFDLTGLEAADLPFTTVAGRDALRAVLQRTRDEGAFVDLFFHQVPPEDVDALRAVLTVVAEFRDRVLPYDRLYPVWARAVY